MYYILLIRNGLKNGSNILEGTEIPRIIFKMKDFSKLSLKNKERDICE